MKMFMILDIKFLTLMSEYFNTVKSCIGFGIYRYLFGSLYIKAASTYTLGC